MRKLVHVAAAVLCDRQGRFLLAKRHAGTHQGGLWEFPGGKREANESVDSALQRELEEELGIRPTQYRPLIRVRHDYGDREVLLETFLVTGWAGEPAGLEGQPLVWAEPARLAEYPMPPADLPILKALRLPLHYLITPDLTVSPAEFLAGLTSSLAHGIRLVQLRLPGLPPRERLQLAEAAAVLCRSAGAELLINSDWELAVRVGAAGVHLKAAQLYQLQSRPLASPLLVGASCHSAAELAMARELDLDFAVLSPVARTLSHPGSTPLGWPGFAELVQEAGLPVYALGGMELADLATALARGGQGIAAIRGLWADTAGNPR